MPAKVAASTLRMVGDVLACGVAGTSASGTQAVRDLATAWGGAAEADLLAGARVPAPVAALVNGTLCQARDFDPIYEPATMLPYAPIISAALATAQLTGASGAEFVTAVAAGADVACRVGDGAQRGLAWSRSATLGYFGAAIAAGLLLHLDDDDLRSAFGLALSQAAGTIQSVVEGTLAKRYQAGFAAHGGVLAALLAARGVTGPRMALEGPFGYFALYEAGDYDRSRVISDLGTDFRGTSCSIKPYPSAREHHGAIEAALTLRGSVAPSEVVAVRVLLPPNAFRVAGGPFGANVSVGSAMASAAYSVAVALVDGNVNLNSYADERLRDPVVTDLARRVRVAVEPGPDERALVPQTVEVRDAAGRAYSHTVTSLLGSPDRPLSSGAVMQKATDCARAARPRVSDPQMGGLMSLVGRLLTLPQVDELFAAIRSRE